MQIDEEFNIRFVSLVKKHRCLYDKKVAEYRNKDYQEKSWLEIARETNESVLHCKERWRNLRACLSRYIKQQSGSDPQHKPYYLTEHMAFLLPFLKSTRPSTSSLESYSIRNYNQSHFESMPIGDGTRMNNLTNASKSEMSDTDSADSINYASQVLVEMQVSGSAEDVDEKRTNEALPHHPKRIKIEPDEEAGQTQKTRHKDEGSASSEHSDMEFFRSILPDIGVMTAQQKRKFKIGILELIDDVLEKYPNEQSRTTNGWKN